MKKPPERRHNKCQQEKQKYNHPNPNTRFLFFFLRDLIPQLHGFFFEVASFAYSNKQEQKAEIHQIRIQKKRSEECEKKKNKIKTG